MGHPFQLGGCSHAGFTVSHRTPFKFRFFPVPISETLRGTVTSCTSMSSERRTNSISPSPQDVCQLPRSFPSRIRLRDPRRRAKICEFTSKKLTELATSSGFRLRMRGEGSPSAMGHNHVLTGPRRTRAWTMSSAAHRPKRPESSCFSLFFAAFRWFLPGF